MKVNEEEPEAEKTYVRAHILINGRVQGVFFRSEITHRARSLGVNGWVRNLSNGSVEALFEGRGEDVKQLLEFCKQGPTGATVKKVDVNWETYSGNYASFQIRY